MGLVIEVAVFGVKAGEPRIDHIEKPSFLTNFVLIHFNTEANRTYTLQFLDTAACGPNNSGLRSCTPSNGVWSTLYVAERLPFTNHYVVPDYRTNRTRFYRLKVIP